MSECLIRYVCLEIIFGNYLTAPPCRLSPSCSKWQRPVHIIELSPIPISVEWHTACHYSMHHYAYCAHNKCIASLGTILLCRFMLEHFGSEVWRCCSCQGINITVIYNYNQCYNYLSFEGYISMSSKSWISLISLVVIMIHLYCVICIICFYNNYYNVNILKIYHVKKKGGSKSAFLI